METPKEKYEVEFIKYQQACMAKSKEKYYIEFYNTISYFNDNNNTP